MSVINISNPRDFEFVLVSEIVITGNQDLWKQKIYVSNLF